MTIELEKLFMPRDVRSLSDAVEVTLTKDFFSDEVGDDYISDLFGSQLAGVLLINEVMFVQSRRYLSPNSDELQPSTVVGFVNCSDVFAWGCADAEEVQKSELPELFRMWYWDRIWGTTKWVCQKRKQRPQPPVEESMRDEGAWDKKMEELPVWGT